MTLPPADSPKQIYDAVCRELTAARAEIAQLQANLAAVKAELAECRQERYGYLGKWP
jgi:F0F1-type ATP synthase membrane subunit b/b'